MLSKIPITTQRDKHGGHHLCVGGEAEKSSNELLKNPKTANGQATDRQGSWSIATSTSKAFLHPVYQE